MDNIQNNEYITTQRTFIVPSFGALVITIGGWCALLQKNNFDLLNLVLLVSGIIVSTGLVYSYL